METEDFQRLEQASLVLGLWGQCFASPGHFAFGYFLEKLHRLPQVKVTWRELKSLRPTVTAGA